MNRFQFAARARQQGVVLIFSLLVLLILAIGAVALLRSVNSSLLSAGNLLFIGLVLFIVFVYVSFVMSVF
jgi:Tfp pilus assembly protein PilX